MQVKSTCRECSVHWPSEGNQWQTVIDDWELTPKYVKTRAFQSVNEICITMTSSWWTFYSYKQIFMTDNIQLSTVVLLIPVKCWTRSETDFCKQHTHTQHLKHISTNGKDSCKYGTCPLCYGQFNVNYKQDRIIISQHRSISCSALLSLVQSGVLLTSLYTH